MSGPDMPTGPKLTLEVWFGPPPESWHDRLRRLARQKDYAGALALLRHPAPETNTQAPAAGTTALPVGNSSPAQEPDDGNGLSNPLPPDILEKT